MSKYLKLNTGCNLPTVGLGTWQVGLTLPILDEQIYLKNITKKISPNQGTIIHCWTLLSVEFVSIDWLLF